ncbi:MAG TPA: hypothetical protein VHN99_09525 [Deinococcales bacterium]|nr:hypothetical protein [Deinococcales bacterium]
MQALRSHRPTDEAAPVQWRYCEFGRHRVYLQPCGDEGWRALIVPKAGRGRARSVYGPDVETATRRAEDFIRSRGFLRFGLPAARMEAPRDLHRAY